ncbi:hypothetical protein IFM89_018499 [Coptis chinensis]|uniref:Uncharacterized protein n=1 Tax=Coptis chinensis TaxID=261450 RepID=A0A835IRE1_9MAGN|nr:hypothetical protein IFM89_018499 [Coptis chinensis]
MLTRGTIMMLKFYNVGFPFTCASKLADGSRSNKQSGSEKKSHKAMLKLGMQPIPRFEIRQVANGVYHVLGLVESHVSNMNDVWEVLQTGDNLRAVGVANAIEHSSRSHWSHIISDSNEWGLLQIEQCILITILVAAKGVFKLPVINNSADLKVALEKRASITSGNTIVTLEEIKQLRWQYVKVLWTPQEENDTLSEKELHEDYPLLKHL